MMTMYMPKHVGETWKIQSIFYYRLCIFLVYILLNCCADVFITVCGTVELVCTKRCKRK